MTHDAWADGEDGKRFIVIHPTMISADADGTLAVDNNIYYQQAVMDEMRLHLTHGGTDVENVYNIVATWLP